MSVRHPGLALALTIALLALSIPSHAQIAFQDATASAGIDDPVDVQGVSFADADDDGDPDLYLTLVLSAFLGRGNQLYINQGSDGAGGWIFTEEADARGVSDDQTSYGPGWADFDNDGDQDLMVANGANAALPDALHLYRNNGRGAFTDEAAALGLSAPRSGRSVAWADFDNDGDLDVFVATPDLVAFGERYYLYRNDGTTFTDVTAATGLNMDTLNTESAVWADYDGDGDQDLYVVNHGVAPFTTEANELWQNQLAQTGVATFVNVARAARVGDTASSTGAAWGDCDNDGDLDLYVATGFDIFSIFGIDAPNRLYRNDGGTFTEMAATAGVPGTDVSVADQVSFSAAWADFDNDGWLDIYVTNSRLELSPTTPSNVMLRNVGNCRFEEVDIGVNDSGSGQGTAVGDYDGDGWLDIFVANLLSGGSQTARLYRNDSATLHPAHHWLAVDTEGVDSNRDGIGALVILHAGGQSFTRHVSAGSGYLSQDSVEVEFGTGTIDTADRLEIRWPSGCVQIVPSPAMDRAMRVVEDCLVGFDSATAVDPDPCDTGLLVDWEPATFASGSGHYEVRRGPDCLSAEASPELLPRVAAPPFLDPGTAADETWYYSVLAFDDVNGTSGRTCAGPVTDEARTGGGLVLDPASLRVARVGAEDPVLGWSILSGSGDANVHRSLVAADWAGGPSAVPVIGSTATSTWLDAGLALGPRGVAHYQVHAGDCR